MALAKPGATMPDKEQDKPAKEQGKLVIKEHDKLAMMRTSGHHQDRQGAG